VSSTAAVCTTPMGRSARPWPFQERSLAQLTGRATGERTRLRGDRSMRIGLITSGATAGCAG
jgi:hypothetical protein